MELIPAPTPPHEAARLALLDSYDILDSGRDVVFDRFVASAAQLFRVPLAGIVFLDRNRQWFKARLGAGPSETPRAIAFCNHAILSDDVLVIEDTARDPRTILNPLVTGEPFIRFYAGAPLVASAGLRLGTLCVLDYQPRHPKPGQVEQLQELAEQVMATLDSRRHRMRFRDANRMGGTPFEVPLL